MRSRRWAASSSGSKSSIVGCVRTTTTGTSAAAACTRRSSRAGRSTRATPPAASSRGSVVRSRARRSTRSSGSSTRSSRKRAPATRTSRPRCESLLRGVRSKCTRQSRSCSSFAGMPPPFSSRAGPRRGPVLGRLRAARRRGHPDRALRPVRRGRARGGRVGGRRVARALPRDLRRGRLGALRVDHAAGLETPVGLTRPASPTVCPSRDAADAAAAGCLPRALWL